MPMQQQRDHRKMELPMQSRQVAVVPASVDSEKRTVDVIWSTGARVRRYDWWNDRYYDEELSLEPGACDLSRLNAGAPFLNSHQAYDLADIIGAVMPDTARIDGGQAVATIQMSARDDVAPIFADMKDGIIRNISVGYIVRKYQIDQTQGEIPVYRAVDWMPMEISAVAIPADAGAQVREQKRQGYPCEIEIRAEAAHNPDGKETPMSDKTERADDKTAANSTTMTQAATTTAETRANPAPVDAEAVRKEAAAQERVRIAEIRSVAGVAKMDEKFIQRHVDSGSNLDQVRKEILEEMAKRSGETEIRGQNTVLGDDPMIGVRNAIENSLLHRFKPSAYQLTDQAREYRHMTLAEVAKEVLTQRGIHIRGRSRNEIVGIAMNLETRAGALSVSDFPAILANVANKTLRAAYDSTPQTYKPFTKEASAADFKQISRTQLSGAPSLVLVNENGEYERGSLSDAKEVYALSTFGKIVPITRQAIINDDLGAFTRIPELLGRAAGDLQSDTVWAIITANGNMQDGVALFHANHGNLAAVNAAITVASLGIGRAAMRQQKGLEGRPINVQPVYLLVPSAQETVAQQYTTQTNIIYTKNADQNPFANTLKPIAEPRLDANSTTAWYLAGDPSQVDTIEYCYLDGAQGPQVTSRIGFDIDGVEVKVSLDFAAKALDWRALFKNIGA